jgi:hypothetical protein
MLSNEFAAFCGRHAGLLEAMRTLLLDLERVPALDPEQVPAPAARRREAIREMRLCIDREIENLRIAA